MSEEKQRICFVHMPKCGGTSIIHALRHPFHRDSVRFKSSRATRKARRLGVDIDNYREERLMELLAKPKYNYVSGHYRCTQRVLDEFADDWAFITLLRNPVNRWFSHYFYNRYKWKSHYKTRMPIDKYLYSDSGQRIGSMYIRFLSAVEDCTSREAIEDAKATLDRYDVVGILEKKDVFVKQFEERFNRPLKIPHKNQNPASKRKQKDLATPELRAEVEKICAPDMEIYNYALGKL